MGNPCIGLQDKLYWRTETGMMWHCYARAFIGRGGRRDERVYEPLCGRAPPLKRSGGQDCRRPRPELRCGRCDGLEADRRGWAECAP